MNSRVAVITSLLWTLGFLQYSAAFRSTTTQRLLLSLPPIKLLAPPPKASLSSADAAEDVPSAKERPLTSDGPASVTWDWEQLASKVFVDSNKPIILFDGICNFCNGGVNLCLDLDEKGHFRYASLQSRVGQALLLSNGKTANDISSIVLVQNEKEAYFESDAVLKIARKLEALPGVVRGMTDVVHQTIPQSLRDQAYHLVANNRYMFGETDGPTCRLDLDGEFVGRFVQDPDEGMNA